MVSYETMPSPYTRIIHHHHTNTLIFFVLPIPPLIAALEVEHRTLNHLHFLHASEIAKLESEAQVLHGLLKAADPQLAQTYSPIYGDGIDYSSGVHFFNTYGYSVASYEHYCVAHQMASREVEASPSPVHAMTGANSLIETPEQHQHRPVTQPSISEFVRPVPRDTSSAAIGHDPTTTASELVLMGFLKP